MTVVLRLSGGEVIVLLAAATNEHAMLADHAETDGYPAAQIKSAIRKLEAVLGEIEDVS